MKKWQKQCAFANIRGLKSAWLFSPFLAFLLITPLENAFADFAYVPNLASGSVSVIDTPTNTVIATVTVGGFPAGVAITPDGLFAYVTNEINIVVIDTGTQMVVATITPDASVAPDAIAIDPITGLFAYVTNIGDGNVIVIDTATKTVVATITVGPAPIAVAITPNDLSVYVANSGVNNVSVIDAGTRAVVATVTVGGVCNGVAISPDGLFAYVVNNVTPGYLSVIDTGTKAVVATVTVGDNPDGLAVTLNGAFVYVADTGTQSVSVINTQAKTIVATITVGLAPIAVAITLNDLSVYVVNEGDNNVSAIDIGTNTVVATVAVGVSPISIAMTLGPVQAPQNLKGQQKKNDYGLVFERFNRLTWAANPSGPAADGYVVYRNGVKIATLPASTLEYEDHNRKKGVTTVYAVTALGVLSSESSAATVTVK